jgi:hypothetical protein
MNSAAFLLAVKRRLIIATPLTRWSRQAHSSQTMGIPDEGQALQRLIVALASGNGEFAESDQWLFSQRTTAIAGALTDARRDGRYSEEEWQRACSF